MRRPYSRLNDGQPIPAQQAQQIARAVFTLLDGREWTADTCADIADVFVSHGFPPADLDDTYTARRHARRYQEAR